MKSFLLAGCIFFLNVVLIAQDDPTLFSVDGTEVAQSEFAYIYEKNNPETADYTLSSLQEYLDLYVKFKLKVAKARAIQMDTISALNEELQVYRNQLAKAYMVDKDVTNNLVQQAFDRKKKDLKVSHILVSVSKRPSADELLKAKNKAKQIRNKIKSKKDFQRMVRSVSDDRSSAQREGEIGWMTAILPDGFYEFENAIYSQEVDEISDPISSKLGYHIIMVTDERPARGEMEVAHILIRTQMKGQKVDGAEAKADSIYQLLVDGQSFESLASKYSDDKNTADKGGHLGYFGITQFDQAFEDAAFLLTENGSYTRPVQTAIGWHIIKRKAKKDFSELSKVRRQLEDRLKQNDRYDLAKAARLENIRSEGQYEEFLSALDPVKASLGDDFYTYKWNMPKVKDERLLSFASVDGQGRDVFTVQDFLDYSQKAVRTRLRMDKKKPVEEGLMQVYDDFVDEKTIQYEEDNLERKYPEFKSLMKEYEEGILVFEAISKFVWKKATADTAGLKEYYNKHQKEYYWKPRGRLHVYTLNTADKKDIKNFKKDLMKLDQDMLKIKYERGDVRLDHQTDLYEVGAEEFLGLIWEEGATYVNKDENKNLTTVKYIEEILPETQKAFKECRGYVIADYQEQVEKQWVKSLRKEFDVMINEDVLKGMVKK